MKKIAYYLLSIVIAGGSLTSCLDEDPLYTMDSKVIFASENNAELALLGCYGYMTSTDAYGQAMQENPLVGSGFAWGQRGGGDDLMSLRCLPTTGGLSTVWNGQYKVINQVNTFLENLEISSLSDEVKVQKGGEAKFLRGLAYYNLVSMFGDVPLRLKTPATTAVAAPRTSKEEVFAQIVQDMKDAMLTAAKSSVGRVNAWAAKAFLGKVYYKMACLDIDAATNWKNAKDMFDDVYSNGPFALEPKFGDLFGDFVNSSKESIFQLNFSVNSEVCFNRASNRFAPPQSTAGIAWGTFKATKAAYDLHEGTYPGDPRIENTFMKAWRTRGGNNQKNPKPMVGDKLCPNDSSYLYPYITYHKGFVDADKKIAVEPMMKGGDPVVEKGKQVPVLHVLKLPYELFPDPKNPSIEVLEHFKLTSGIRDIDLAKLFSTDTGQNKWPHFTKLYDQNQVGTAGHKNLMVYRYAEMLLLMADVYNELGNTAKAIELANEVLGRARTSGLTPAAQPADWSMSLDQETVRTKLYFERIIELAGEPSLYDMVRIRGVKYFKMALELHNNHELTKASDEQYLKSVNAWHDRVFNGTAGLTDDYLKMNLLLPVPLTEISANPGINTSDNNFGY